MKSGSKKRGKNRKRYLPLLFMTLPGSIYLIINNYIPMFGVTIAFKNYNFAKGYFHSDWVGFKNFEFLFRSPNLIRIIRNTLLYNLVFIVLSTIIAIMLAVIMNEIRSKIVTRIFQTAILLPYIISMVLVSYIVYSFLNPEHGFINNTILPILGLKPVAWYYTAKPWVAIIPIVYIWKNVGFSTIIYFASVVGIDQELYEAAKVDGATKWKQITNITLPQLTPVVSIMTILAIGRIFSADFGLFFQVPMNSSAIYSTTQVVETYVYQALLKVKDVGMSSSVGLLQSVIGCVLLLAANAMVRRLNKDNALL